jgi:hypothetical protein
MPVRLRRNRGTGVLLTVAALAATVLGAGQLPAAAQAPTSAPSTTPPPLPPLTRPPLGPTQPTLVPSVPAGPPPAPTPTVPPVPKRDDPAPWDLSGQARKAINEWLAGIITSALRQTFDLLTGSVALTPTVGQPGRVRELWTGCLALANSLLVLLLVLAGGLLMSHETVQTRYYLKEIMPRGVVAVLFTNLSLMLCDQAIRLTNALAVAFLGTGVGPGGGQFADRLREVTERSVEQGGDVLLVVGLMVAILAVALLLCWVLRMAMIVLLVVASPLALASHALPGVDGIAALWWRAFAACLGIQLTQALTLAAAVRVFFSSDGPAMLGLRGEHTAVDLMVVGGLLCLLVAIPVWSVRLVLGPRARRNIVVRVATAYAYSRILYRR